ncbi:gephyrin isoform X2 [Monomorium pharaonis]|uniref:gephyrin isoform X2 n=1 Tax=Monomorium pharaonis TaxID=307658 RepID=UPI0017463790|nr:gephyrin isoform X2 [Monomorium pharaonis]XP_036149974.1 gephyrin isoform X2 [Monomorium pharaonis]
MRNSNLRGGGGLGGIGHRRSNFELVIHATPLLCIGVATERQCANEAIQIINNNNELNEEQKNLITRIETKLELVTCAKAVCGIRKKTLIINLSGLEDKVKLLAKIVDSLDNALCVIHNNKYPSSPQSDNDSSNQEIDENSDESILTLSCDEAFDIKDNPNNRNKKLFPTISLEEALIILDEVAYTSALTRNTELVKSSDAYGRVLSENIFSNCNVPPFRTSSKHGYAVLASDGQKLRKLLHGKNYFPPISLQPGTCVWVDSGAPIPDEATSVVHVKDTQMLECLTNDDVYIDIMTKPRHMQNIRPIGYDLAKGHIVINEFTRIGPEEMAILAASGCKDVLVFKQLSIGVLSIGDNLEEPGEPLKPGYVHDINRITLISLLRHNGFSSLDLGIVNDNSSSIKENIEQALSKVDILVTTGSVNDKDLLKNILTKYFRAKIYFGNIDIKPGKSTTFAKCMIDYKPKHLLCFSGNPLSAITTAQLFLLPFVNKISGYKLSDFAVVPVHVDEPFISHRRLRFVWSRIKWSEKQSLMASNMDNLYNDKLCNIVGSNALLSLPKILMNCKLLSQGFATMVGYLIDFRLFDNILS